MLPLKLLANLAVQAKTNTKTIYDAIKEHPDIPESVRDRISNIAGSAHVTTDALTDVLQHLLGW